MNEKQNKVDDYLNKVNAKELSYSEARDALMKNGFSDEEIILAVSKHVEEKPKPYVYGSNAVPDEATVAIAKAKLGFVTERALRDEQITAAAAAIIVPNKYAKSYFFNKFLKKHADAKNIEENGKLDPIGKGSLYDKYRLIRYNTLAGLIGLVVVLIIAGPSLWQIIMQLFLNNGSGLATKVFFLLGLVSWILCFTSPIVFLLIKKESTLKAYIIGACIIPGLLGITLGLVVENYLISALALFGILFALWQSNRVGVLSLMSKR